MANTCRRLLLDQTTRRDGPSVHKDKLAVTGSDEVWEE